MDRTRVALVGFDRVCRTVADRSRDIRVGEVGEDA